MTAIIFDGLGTAKKYEVDLAERVSLLADEPRMLSIVFREDAGSQLYTRLKFEAAARVGVEFDRLDFNFSDSVQELQKQIRHACSRTDVDGVMIQKPAKSKWNKVMDKKGRGDFANWWNALASTICPEKDVDCLSPQNLSHVYAGDWKLLPATVRGVLMILEIAMKMEEKALTRNDGLQPLGGLNVAVLGRSEIVGRPLAEVLRQKGASVDVCGSKTEDLGLHTAGADVLVSATGVKHVVKEDLVKPGVVVIDVGSPNPDVDYEHVKKDASFITPVPYGVGPMTVVSLLMNLVGLVRWERGKGKHTPRRAH